jgi:hypothetical protein
VSEIKVDVSNLYREENFTDLQVASIRRLTPIKPDGSPDDSRQPIFIGETHVMTSAGAVPVQAPIEAQTLDEATRKFPEAVQHAVQEMIEEVREYQRQQASRIIVPQAGPGGKIQLG